MFMNGMSFRGRFCAALAGAGLLLTQLATAGQPALLVFGGKPIVKQDYRIEWSQKAPEQHDDYYVIKGTLFHRADSSKTGNKSSDIPVRGATIKYSYVIKDKDGNPSSSPIKEDSSKTGVDNINAGEFIAKFAPPKKEGEIDLEGGIELTAKYYGDASEGEDPLAKATKELKKHLELGVDGDPDLLPEDLKGTYKFKPKMVSWNDVETDTSNIQLVEAENALLPRTNPHLLDFAKDIEVDQDNKTVKHKGETAGVIAVRAEAGELKSEPVWLAFGANASLERVGDHKDEEIILQRPHGYNADYGMNEEVTSNTVTAGKEFFTDEHAQLQLTLTSLLTGKPLKDVPVTWSIPSTPVNMSVFLSDHVDSSPKSHQLATDSRGIATSPVSARHGEKDTVKPGDPVPGDENGKDKKIYKTATGIAKVWAEFKGQSTDIGVPFIDSLWVVAQPKVAVVAVGQTVDVDFKVVGYVGTDGKTQAKRTFDGFVHENVSEQSVAGDSSGKGSVVFTEGKKEGATIKSGRVYPLASDGRLVFGGLSLQTGTKDQLTGIFKAYDGLDAEKGDPAAVGLHTLTQHWPVYMYQTGDNPPQDAPYRKYWWGHAGTTLMFKDGDQLTDKLKITVTEKK
ncbi:MAG: hypothetical protein OXC07_03790 [Kistimonas sp.]|nr:hypothetical protein [Kistimonas sp.]